ncbi:MAG TPA: HD domain-containing phosphohydrolase [Cellvibrionaceae bacterium]|nr:HD domain-containing phosphohydrolase [Cellvibrionaceae bacterium]
MGAEVEQSEVSAHAYSEHLALVNEVSRVVAIEDIRNVQGQLLVAKGGEIDNRLAEKVLRFKLLRPIEDSVAIENEFNVESLLRRIDYFLEADPFLKFLKDLMPPLVIKSCCEAFCRFAVLRQKLTVLAIQLPIVFEQALFVAWFGVLVRHKSKGSPDECMATFIAGLAHDFGMLHISPTVLNKQGAFEPEEWRQMQAHPIIGAKILQVIAKLPPEVARGVLEHHENLDGTGYPRGLVGDKLAALGQALNLLDSLFAIYRKYFKPFNRSLRDLIPIIQMNSHSRYGSAGAGAIMLLKKLPENKACGVPLELMPDFVAAVKARNNYLTRNVKIINEMATQIGYQNKNPRIIAIQNSIIHIAVSLVQSGIINDAYMRWLDQVLDERLEFAYREVEEAFILMQEVVFHLDKLKQQLISFVEFDPDAGKMPFLIPAMEQLDAVPMQPIPDSLRELWVGRMVVY